jgi:hypothetical protein
VRDAGNTEMFPDCQERRVGFEPRRLELRAGNDRFRRNPVAPVQAAEVG